MNSNANKRLLSLLLVVCMLVGILAVLPIKVPVSAADIATSGNYFFKVGAKSALASGTRVTLDEAPFEYGGTVYIPVSALTAVAAAPTAGITTVNGVQAVSLNSISVAYSGYYGSISNMNLIVISQTQNFFSNHTDAEQVTLMKKFLFDNIATDGSTLQNNFDVSDMTSVDHPYLYANQSRFDELRAIYLAGKEGQPVDEVLYGYITNRLTYAKSQYDKYAKVDSNGNYTGMNTTVNLSIGNHEYIYQIPYAKTGSGYDAGGRLNEAATNNERILLFAFAYQMTGDMNYAKLAYQYATYMGQWEHWGPGHFLNAADASSPYAVAYDWLYDAWKELEEAGETCLYYDGKILVEKAVTVAAIEEVIFTHSIVPAYYSISIAPTSKEQFDDVPWWSTTVGASGYVYHTDENNWNAVCAAGITVAALALVGSTTASAGTMIDTTATDSAYNPTTDFTTYGNHSGFSTYQDYAEYLINRNIYYLPLNGLGQYVPDGSYIESNAYWSYGTNNIYEMVAALTSTTGSHYGILDAWGLDNTAYFALNTMSSDGLSYNYHDSNSVTPQDTSWFMYLGTEDALGDKTLAGIRRDLNANLNQNASYYDIIYYMSEDEIGEYEYPELQYWMEGIDGYVMRDSWNPDEGSLFAGFMGRENDVTHGQVDSGAFVYYNKGTRWFCDLGTDEYNAYNFWSQPYRANYYAMGAEGNNTLILTGDVLSDSQKAQGNGDGAVDRNTFFGQYLSGGGSITKQGNNAYGAYAVLDNTSAYNYSYKYSETSSNGCGGTSTESKTGTGSAASSALRGMFLTNDRKTYVIQDQVTFNHAQDVAWIAHTLPSVEVILSIDGTVAYLSDGTTVIKATIIDPDGAGLTFRHAFCTDDEFLLDNTNSYDYSAVENGDETANKDYSTYQKLMIEATGVTSFNVAVVIEEVILGETMNDEAGVGYTWTDMNSWTPYADSREDDISGGEGEVEGPVATVTVTSTTGEELDPDTPIVDLWSAEAAAASVLSTVADESAEGEVNTYEANSFEELQSYINANKGSEIVVELHASNSTPITISAPCTINTNGNKLLATSTSYVASVSGDTVEYKKGSVTVKWILSDGNTVIETYTGSVVARYKGSITESSTIYEVDNGDGTYSYYTSGNAWALSENGKQVSDNDLIVSSENNVFYQTGKQYDGLFVSVASNGTITGYTKADDLFSSTLRNSAYERISITNDFSYDATGKSDNHNVTKTMNIYLNGYTITYTSADLSDHMFKPQTSGVELNIYGPGTMRNEASGSNFISGAHQAGASVLIEGVDIYSSAALIDHRYGTAIFRDCNITIETSAPAFSVHNRNNKSTSTPYIIVDGCVINLPLTTTNGVIQMINNVTAEITGGTSIIAFNEVPLFNILTQTQGTGPDVDTFDWSTSCSSAQAVIGEVYHTGTLATYGTKYESDGTADGDAIKSSATPTDANVFYGKSYQSATDPSSLNILSGLVAAKYGESSYVIADPADCAEVIWKSGTTTLGTEYWLAGYTPVASSAIKSGVTVADGKMISFVTEEAVAGASVTYTAIVIDSFGLKVNMSLQGDFNLNFFIENIGNMTFKIDGVEVTPDTESMSGYYKVTKYGINPANAGKSVKLEVSYNGSTLSKTISPMDYAQKVLSDTTQSAEARAMMINIVKYVEAAYVYIGNNVGETASDYSKVLALYNEYKSLATAAVVDRKPVNMSNVNDALSGAQLNLDTAPKFRFNLKSDYTGNVTFAYTNANGEVVERTYSVKQGICNGLGYVEITLKAYNMLDDITITTAKGTATYNLANYYHYEVTELGALTNLLNALCAYCETAKNYQATLE